MKRILIVDTETTGTDTNTDHVVEVGAILWSVEHHAALRCWSEVIRRDTAGPQAAQLVHGITDELAKLGRMEADVGRAFRSLARHADAIVAHNADFDRAFVDRLGWIDLPWIDSMFIPWPIAAPDMRLQTIALAHGVGITKTHRALSDCELLAETLERCARMGSDVRAMLEHAALPRDWYVPVDCDDKDVLQEHRFYWDQEREVRRRRLLPGEAEALPFWVVTEEEAASWPTWVSLAPFKEKDTVKAHGFSWDAERKHWWRKMPAELVERMPFAAVCLQQSEGAA